MGNESVCASVRDQEVMLEELKVPAEAKECVACQGHGMEIRASGELECRFCEGRGWVLPVECCSCGRPGGQAIEKLAGGALRKFVLCTRQECVEKFIKSSVGEFEAVGYEVVSEDENWDGWIG